MWIAGTCFPSLPLPIERQDKGKGFQGECYNCAEKGHPARECPRGKEGGNSKRKGDGYTRKGKGSWSWGTWDLAGRWRRASRRLEVGAAGGGKASWKHPIGWKSENEHGRRRLRDGPTAKTKELGQYMPEIFCSGRREIRI